MPKLPPVPKTFTSVIAERTLSVRSPGGSRALRIQIGAPIQDVPTVSGFDWRCPVRFTGQRRVLQAYGADSLQSLVHALKFIQVELTSIEREPGTRLLWFDELGHGVPHFELST
jgi:hypothetical protein